MVNPFDQLVTGIQENRLLAKFQVGFANIILEIRNMRLRGHAEALWWEICLCASKQTMWNKYTCKMEKKLEAVVSHFLTHPMCCCYVVFPCFHSQMVLLPDFPHLVFWFLSALYCAILVYLVFFLHISFKCKYKWLCWGRNLFSVELLFCVFQGKNISNPTNNFPRAALGKETILCYKDFIQRYHLGLVPLYIIPCKHYMTSWPCLGFSALAVECLL